MPRLHGETVTKRAAQVGDATHSAIARRLSLTQSTVSRLIAGTTTPSLPTLLRLRAAYGISLDDLVAEDVPDAEATTSCGVGAR
ncbi:helix-turn-helix transcriptional regulator [Streptomyces eurythermus]